MTRIESARCEGADGTFAGLADDVTKLSGQIREQIDTTGVAAAVLLGTISKAAGEIRLVNGIQRENLGPLTRQASAGVRRIGERHNIAAEATKVLGARFETISRAIDEVVMALQSHDIVRQQIEHVVEALRVVDDPGHLPEAARLQEAQLSHSRETFEASVTRIRDAMGHIERSIRDVAEESAHLLGLSGGRERSFFVTVQSDLDGVLTLLDGQAKADRLLGEKAASVHEGVSAISRTIADIHLIGIQMQRIAMNATLRAARLGPAGGALETVAHSIQALAHQTEMDSGTLDDRLHAVREGASVLAEATAARGGSEVQIAHLRRSAEALGSIEDKARGDYTRTTALTDELQRQIRETAAAFGTQEESVQAMDIAREMLRGLCADGLSACSTASDAMVPGYTMHSQRAVHAALYQADGGEEVAIADESLALPDDNVEFF
jgi:hypothetical protein